MKKFLLFFVLVFILTGVAFADHPDDQLGIGPLGGWYVNWEGGGFGQTALNLKIPYIPVFWTLYLGFGQDYFFTGISGDVYIIEKELVPEINLHWFLGVGGWVNIGLGDSSDFSLGARVPVGLSWHILDFMELFSDIAPSLGVRLIPDFHFPGGGLPIEIGVRFWL